MGLFFIKKLKINLKYTIIIQLLRFWEDAMDYYDYSDLIKEIKEELEDGILKPDNIVQI